jgi:hypothetical protein
LNYSDTVGTIGMAFSVAGLLVTSYLLYRAAKIRVEVTQEIAKIRTAFQHFDAATELASIQLSIKQLKGRIVDAGSIPSQDLSGICVSIAKLIQHLKPLAVPYSADLNRVSTGLKDIEREILRHHFGETSSIDWAGVSTRLTRYEEKTATIATYLRNQVGVEAEGEVEEDA